MGIYIKGEKMPETCSKCKLFCNEYMVCGVTGFPFRSHEMYERRMNDCHLVPVPPHGRLGDLDEIERYKERLVVDADKIKPEIRYVVDTKYIKEAPTVIPAEEGET